LLKTGQEGSSQICYLSLGSDTIVEAEIGCASHQVIGPLKIGCWEKCPLHFFLGAAGTIASMSWRPRGVEGGWTSIWVLW
jgi:hypothetical protein